ncbi:MAG: CRTAC1 family protein [Armatimonadota bacterium]
MYDADTHRLFRKTPKGFVDVTKASGIEVNTGRGLAVAFVDYDQDGRQDIFVANDLSPSFLWHNNGGLKFTDKAVEAGCAYSENGSLMAGMGIAIADYDRTSRLSMFVTNFAGMPNTLFKNIGDGFFENAADTSRIAQAHMKHLSFGCEFLDYDNDGWQDLMTADGHVQLSVALKQSVGVKQAKRRYRNAGNATFTPIEAPDALGPLAEPVISRGLATADINNDGFVDVLATNQNSPAQLFLNRGSEEASSVSFILRGRKSNADGSHARITLISPSGQKQVDWVKAGSNYLSASDRRVIFGTGDTKGDYSATIQWPSGVVDKVSSIKPGALYEIVEGNGLKTTVPYKRP